MFKQSDLIRILNRANQEVVVGSILDSVPYQTIKQNRINALNALVEAITDLFPEATGVKSLVINKVESMIAAILQHVLDSPEIDVAGEIETPGIVETLINIFTEVLNYFDTTDEEEEIDGLQQRIEDLENDIVKLDGNINILLDNIYTVRGWSRNWYNAIKDARDQSYRVCAPSARGTGSWDEPGLPIDDAGNWDRDCAMADAYNSCRKGYHLIINKLRGIENQLE